MHIALIKIIEHSWQALGLQSSKLIDWIVDFIANKICVHKTRLKRYSLGTPHEHAREKQYSHVHVAVNGSPMLQQ